MLRIIGGKYKGKKLFAVDDTSIRPTKEMAKEAIFNSLNSGKYLNEDLNILINSKVLDVFSGSGALALEAISRGASHACLIEINPAHVNIARKNIAALGIADRVHMMQEDALNLPLAKESFDIIFLDPPYNKNFLFPALKRLKEKKWISSKAIIICECSKNEILEEIEGLKLLEERIYRKSKFILLQAQ